MGGAERWPRLRAERGIALVVAIVALVVIGAIVAGTFFVGSLEQRTAVNAVDAAQAYQAAEAGIVRTVAHWDPAYNGLGVDESVTAPPDSVARGVFASVTVSRLNASLFLVRSVGTRRGATQTLASVLRLRTVDPRASAALSTTADVNLSGSVGVDGAAAVPAGWTACAAAPDASGIRAGGSVQVSGQPDIAGSPAAVQRDSTMTDALLRAPFEQLARTATLSLAGGSGPGNFAVFNGIGPSAAGAPATCDRANPGNWGEPLRSGGFVTACVGYAPVVYVDGNAKIEGSGRGQGILLVRGDLSIAGGFTWVGLVMATGRVSIADAGGAITGALIARTAAIAGSAGAPGRVAVAYSKCALDYALRNAAVARPLPTRSWTQVF